MAKNIQPFSSRQVMQKKTFEIFHYHQARAERIEVHHHDFYEIYLFLQGKVDYRVEGRIYHLEPGDLLFISPMELHQLTAEDSLQPYERIVLWIDKTYLDSLSAGDIDLSRCFSSQRPNYTNLLRLTPSLGSEIRLRMDELVRETYHARYGSSLCAQGIFLQLMVQLNRLAIGTEASRGAPETTPLIAQVLSFIAAHYHEPLTLDALARRFYVSKYYLSHEFSRIVGTSVYRYITMKRLQIARQLLNEGAAPGTIYSTCGFQDYTNFYRAFKAQYGISPKECHPETE